MNRAKHARQAHRLANLALFHSRLSYEAQGDLEKVIGDILTGQMGITDAPKSVFEKIKSILKEDGTETALDSPDFYPYLQRAIMEALDEEGLI